MFSIFPKKLLTVSEVFGLPKMAKKKKKFEGVWDESESRTGILR